MSANSFKKLRDVVLFRDLDAKELEKVADACQEVRFPGGATIIQESSVGDSMYVILEGAVKVHKQDFFGGKEVITTLHEGDHFGELSLFDSAPRSAAVTAIRETLLLELKGPDLHRIMASDAHLAQSIYRSVISELAYRLRETNEHLIYLVGRSEETKN